MVFLLVTTEGTEGTENTENCVLLRLQHRDTGDAGGSVGDEWGR